MRILLTNDDGYKSQGLITLEEVLLSYGHEVWVIAPSSNCSAFSHKVSVTGKVKMTEYKKLHYHCSGTPSDCILYGSKAKFLPSAPDLVISGINQGGNMSTDILYSGTCAAACEAALHSIKAMALSCEPNEKGEYNYKELAIFVSENLDKLYPHLDHTRYISINVPYKITKGVKVATLGYLKYPDGVFKDGESEYETDYSFISGAQSRYLKQDSENIDFNIVDGGGISISFLSVLPALDEDGQRILRELYE